MKKFLALILAALMLTCMLAGCSNDANVDEPISGNGDDATSDADYIMNNGKMIIGITLFAPMNYYDDANNLIGFETEFAKAVCEKIGVAVPSTVSNAPEIPAT